MTALPRIDDGGGSGVELLERAINYTRGTLGDVTPDDLCRPTPCSAWRLGDLLAHMEDSLDAFTEGAAGRISLAPHAATPLERRLAALHHKACHLLGAWTHADAAQVNVGGQVLPVPLVSRVAAIEIAVHGWDVGCAVGRPPLLPGDLADSLLPTAALVVREYDGFGPPRRASYDATPGDRLLALLGRDPAWR